MNTFNLTQACRILWHCVVPENINNNNNNLIIIIIMQIFIQDNLSVLMKRPVIKRVL